DATIFPLNELIYDEIENQEFIKKIKGLSNDLPNFILRDLNDFENYENLERINKYIKYLEKNPVTLLDYLDDKIVVYNEYSRLKENYQTLLNDLENYITSLNKPKNLDLMFFFDIYSILHNVSKKIFLQEARQSLNDIPLTKVYSLNGYSVIDYQNDIKNLIEDLKANKNKTYVFAFKENERLYLLQEILSDGGIEVNVISKFRELKRGKINLIKVENAISYGIISDNI